MTIRFYPSAGLTDDLPMTPTPISGLDDTSVLVRSRALTAIASASESFRYFSDSDDTLKGIAFLQIISRELMPGQTVWDNGIDPVTSVAFCMKAHQSDIRNNMYFNIAVRIINIDGPTVNKTLLTLLPDDNEVPGDDPPVAQDSSSRYLSWITDGLGDYTTVRGDFIVIDIGLRGDPQITYNHTSNIVVGSTSKSDLPASDGNLTGQPWVQLTNQTLTFRNIKKVNGLWLPYVKEIDGTAFADIKSINGTTI
jgi:hypothetical protein